MLPEDTSIDNFQRNTSSTSSGSSTRSSSLQKCRRKLQTTFDEGNKGDKEEKTQQNGDRTILSMISFSDNTRKVLRSSAERITKTFNTVRTSIGTITQRFKMPTKRRQILQEGPMTPNMATPYTFSKQILGRTPTKLYSPFGIESPYKSTTCSGKENIVPNNVKNI
ncbi:unnamed protein product [Acanthoscelides obtectus]|uniref:Uncharacterized protein n=1 Tax=Acanthoscelides obtectus TaxID=200917 RepID=A0A9P0JNS7_ACAOB|nr:unnamed protein product [Acanthoscelides obtectus]CAK1649860.1 hypothetical protein AOBTE_LOCUS16464 [Acanthoscelides obtectus]